MPGEQSYYYFVATLPALAFDRAAPWSREEFIENSAPWISETDLLVLRAAYEGGDEIALHPAGAAWREWDEGFRNAIAAARAQRQNKDAGQYQRGTAIVDGYTRAAVQDLVKGEDPLKLERGLDEARWAYLDELSATHIFDFYAVFSYFQKLGILERWTAMNEKEGMATLDRSIVLHEKETDKKQAKA